MADRRTTMAKKTSSRSKASLNPVDLVVDPAWRVVLVHGKDAFLQLDVTASIRQALMEVHGQIETCVYDGQSDAPAEVLDECRSFGLMSSHKLVIVENADQLVREGNRAIIERYVENPCENATLVLRAVRWYASNLDKMVAKVGAVCKCDGVNAREALTWIGANTLRRHGVRIDRAAGQLLIDRLGPDLGRINSELAKLALAAGGTPQSVITAELVAEMVSTSKQQDPWTIQSVLLSGDPNAMLHQLALTLDNAPRDAHIPVMYAYSDLARKLHGMAVANEQRINPAQAAKMLKLWGSSARALTELAPRLKTSRTRALLASCLLADQGLKSGLGEPRRVLERLGLRFARLTRPSGR